MECEMTTQAFHKRWLKVAAVVIGSFAPVFFLGTMVWSSEPARFTMDLLSWPPDGGTTWTHSDTRFLSALTGGFLLGWGVTVWCLAEWVHDHAPEAVRRTVLAGLLAWFVLDSAGSIASGNASNALFNVAVLLLAVGPLWRPACRSGGQAA
jgi:biotin transporter BioY